MSFDGLVTHGLVSELQSLLPARINKVQMPSANDIVMQLRAGGKKIRSFCYRPARPIRVYTLRRKAS